MSQSGDAAEQVVRLSLEGVEAVAKISGKGAMELAKLLLAEAKKPQRTKGRASLMTLLKQKKPIKVFEIDDKSLKKFCQEAKKYGVMYHVLKDRTKNDGKCDIMVKAEDVSKINRIFERFHLGINNKAEIKSSIGDKQTPERDFPDKSPEDRFIDELFKQPQKEKAQNDNPSQAKTETSRPSEPSSGMQKVRQESTVSSPEKRPSVKKQLDQYKKQIQTNKRTAPSQPNHNYTKPKNKMKGR